MKNKFWVILVAILVVINLLSLGLHFKGRFLQKRKMGDSPRQERYLKQRMGFSQDQLKQIQVLRSTHFEELRPLEEELMLMRKELFLEGSGKADSLDVSNRLALIGGLQRKIDSLTYAHFQQIRNLCSPEQARKFGAFVEDMAKRRLDPGGGRGPRDHHRKFQERHPDTQQ